MSPEIYSSNVHIANLDLGIALISSSGALHPPSSVFKSLLDPTSTPSQWPRLSPVSHSSGARMVSAGSRLHTSLSKTSSTHQLEKRLLKKGTTSSATSQLKDNNSFLLSVGQVQLSHG